MLTQPIPSVDAVQDFDPPVEHFTPGCLPQQERETQECAITDTVTTSSGALAPSTAIPQTISTSVLTDIPKGKKSWISAQALHAHYQWLFLIKDTQFSHLIFYWTLRWTFWRMLPMKIYCVLRRVVRLVTGQPALHAVNTAGSNCETMGALKHCDHQNTCLVSPALQLGSSNKSRKAL